MMQLVSLIVTVAVIVSVLSTKYYDYVEIIDNFTLYEGDLIYSIDGNGNTWMGQQYKSFGLGSKDMKLWYQSCNEGSHTQIQSDGNIIIFDSDNKTIQWQSNTGGHSSETPFYLVVDYHCGYLMGTNGMIWSKSHISDNDGCLDYPGPMSTGIITQIQACDDWDYGSTSDTFRMQLKGTQATTEFFAVNKYRKLPSKGRKFTYYIKSTVDIGKLYSVMISVDDAYGFCLNTLSLNLMTDNNGTIISYVFDSDYFGSGVILASNCPYSHRFISRAMPLISCFDEYTEFSVASARGIYNVDIHTCIDPQSGIGAHEMKDNMYAVIMGTKSGHDGYISTDISYLDHFVPGELNIDNLGHLIATNFKIPLKDREKAIVSEVEGTLIGMKLEMVDWQKHKFDTTRWQLKVRIFSGDKSNILYPENLDTHNQTTFANGRYLVFFFYYKKETSGDIFIYCEDGIDYAVNVYGIYEEYNNLYGLPFVVERIEDGPPTTMGDMIAATWGATNKWCNEKHHSSLASIHSEEENYLIKGYLGYGEPAFIGLYAVANSGETIWNWIDSSSKDYINWASNHADLDSGSRCASINGSDSSYQWFDLSCGVGLPISYVCASPHWPSNTNRVIQINTKEKIDNITLISIGNTNADDAICIDSVSVNDEPVVYLSDNWISGGSESFVLNGILKYPVCKTEVIGIDIDYDSSISNLISGDSIIAGMKCTNENKVISSTCSISQSYATTKTTSFSISNENSETHSYSWGHSDTFSWGLSEEVKVHLGGPNNWGEVTVGGNQQWTHESHSEHTDSKTSSSGTAASYETSQTNTIQCNGEITVPPTNSVEYSLIFNAFNTTIRTYTDLKLTLCSEFIESDKNSDTDSDTDTDTDESKFVYIEDIPGIIQHKEITTCDVVFSPAEYIINDASDREYVSCAQEQRLRIAAGSTFVPRCQTDNALLYDGCQCDIGDSRVLAECWCSDKSGNLIGGTLTYVEDGMSWKSICAKLKCDNSTQSQRRLLPQNNGSNGNTVWINDIITVLLEFISLFLLLVLINKCCLYSSAYFYYIFSFKNKNERDIIEELL